MKNTIIAIFLAASLCLPVLTFAQDSEVDAGMTPESKLYFLDRFFERIQEILAFSKEAKAKIQVAFAAERVAEVKAMIEAKGVEAPGLEVALSRLEAHKDKAAGLVKQLEQGKKPGVAKEVDDDFDEEEEKLAQLFAREMQELKRTFKVARENLKVKIVQARKDKNEELLKDLQQQLTKLETDYKIDFNNLKDRFHTAKLQFKDEEEELENELDEIEKKLEKQQEELEAKEDAKEELEEMLKELDEEQKNRQEEVKQVTGKERVEINKEIVEIREEKSDIENDLDDILKEINNLEQKFEF